MNRFPAVAVVVPLLLLAGCTTAYRPDQGRGGYSETALSEDSYRVQFRGNRQTSGDRAHELLLRRCGELATAGGWDGFVVLESTTGKTLQEVTVSERYQEITGTRILPTNKCRTGELAEDGVTLEGYTATDKVPLATALIRLYRGEPPAGGGEVHVAGPLPGLPPPT